MVSSDEERDSLATYAKRGELLPEAGRVNNTLPETLFKVAVIVVTPAATVVARPVVLPMVATPMADDDQVTEVVMSWVEVSL